MIVNLHLEGLSEGSWDSPEIKAAVCWRIPELSQTGFVGKGSPDFLSSAFGEYVNLYKLVLEL